MTLFHLGDALLQHLEDGLAVLVPVVRPAQREQAAGVRRNAAQAFRQQARLALEILDRVVGLGGEQRQHMAAQRRRGRGILRVLMLGQMGGEQQDAVGDMLQPLARDVADLERAERGRDLGPDLARHLGDAAGKLGQLRLMLLEGARILGQLARNLRDHLGAFGGEQLLRVRHALDPDGQLAQLLLEAGKLALALVQPLEHVLGEAGELGGAGRRDLDVHTADAQEAERAAHLLDMLAEIAAGLADGDEVLLPALLQFRQADQPVGRGAHVLDGGVGSVAVHRALVTPSSEATSCSMMS